MMRIRLLSYAILSLTAALLIAACGDGDDAGGGEPAPTFEAQASPTTAVLGEDELGLPARPPAPPVTPENGTPGAVELTWWGHAMFELSSPGGADILMDPYSEIGYVVPNPSVAFVTVSHEHGDHSNAEVGSPDIVFRGLTSDGWAEIDERPATDVRIRSVPSWHDESQGDERGRNAIFVFETGGLRIAHLGDLGHALTPAQLDAIGPVDVLLIPVGGFFTIDASAATEVVEQVGPRVVIPMHYKTKDVDIRQLQPVQPFLGGKQVENMGSSVTLDAGSLPPPGSAVVWVLEPAGAQP